MASDDLGLCWLRGCKALATVKLKAGWHAEHRYELVLCADHHAELEASATFGYSIAKPPGNGQKWWPWMLTRSED